MVRQTSWATHCESHHANLPSAEIIHNLDLIVSAVEQFDVRFTLRALRAISSIRKQLGKGEAGREKIKALWEARSSSRLDKGKASTANKKGKVIDEPILPEEEIYVAILEQVRQQSTVFLGRHLRARLRSSISIRKNTKLVPNSRLL